MSLCDSCYAPGACCKRFHLNKTTWDDEGPEKLLADKGLPFVVIEKNETWQDENGRSYSDHWYSCTKLQPDGRCGIYEDRPELCRIFEPGSDPLCVHYRGAESGDPTIQF